MDVVEIRAEDTNDLRRRVLRHGTLSDAVVFDGDDEATTFHLGVRNDDGDVVATSTWLCRPHHSAPSGRAYQLRGMAVEPTSQGTGVGTVLLAGGLTACAERGATVVWAHARSTALAFYLRHGFDVAGEEYVDDVTGLPHVDVVRSIAD